jgi:hypothetical protein
VEGRTAIEEYKRLTEKHTVCRNKRKEYVEKSYSQFKPVIQGVKAVSFIRKLED